MRKSASGIGTATLLLVSCGQDPSSAPLDAPASQSETAFVNPSKPRPAPRLVEDESSTYYYVTAVSEEDEKKGKAVGNVIGFRYLGKNDKGQHTLRQITKDGKPLSKSFCSEPCRIIKYEDGERVAYDPSSIIGAAFQDAINGHLKAASTNDVERLDYPRTVSTVPKAFRGARDELTDDNCEGREARYVLQSTKFRNFEVVWAVTKVDLFSADEIDLHTTTKDENGDQVNEVWQFKLADGGKSLTSRKPGTTFFRRCPLA